MSSNQFHFRSLFTHDSFQTGWLAFRGTSNDAGEVERLKNVQVMRAGKIVSYSFSELVSGDVTTFCAGPGRGGIYLIHPRGFTGERSYLLAHNDGLQSDVVNPGGSVEPTVSSVITPQRH